MIADIGAGPTSGRSWKETNGSPPCDVAYPHAFFFYLSVQQVKKGGGHGAREGTRVYNSTSVRNTTPDICALYAGNYLGRQRLKFQLPAFPSSHFPGTGHHFTCQPIQTGKR